MVGDCLSLDSDNTLLPLPIDRNSEQSIMERTKIEPKFHTDDIEGLRALFYGYSID